MAKSKRPVPAKHNYRCDVEGMQDNIRHLIYFKNFSQTRAVAAAYSMLRKACGCLKYTPRLTTSEIVRICGGKR